VTSNPAHLNVRLGNQKGNWMFSRFDFRASFSLYFTVKVAVVE